MGDRDKVARRPPVEVESPDVERPPKEMEPQGVWAVLSKDGEDGISCSLVKVSFKCLLFFFYCCYY